MVIPFRVLDAEIRKQSLQSYSDDINNMRRLYLIGEGKDEFKNPYDHKTGAIMDTTPNDFKNFIGNYDGSIIYLICHQAYTTTWQRRRSDIAYGLYTILFNHTTGDILKDVVGMNQEWIGNHQGKNPDAHIFSLKKTTKVAKALNMFFATINVTELRPKIFRPTLLPGKFPFVDIPVKKKETKDDTIERLRLELESSRVYAKKLELGIGESRGKVEVLEHELMKVQRKERHPGGFTPELRPKPVRVHKRVFSNLKREIDDTTKKFTLMDEKENIVQSKLTEVIQRIVKKNPDDPDSQELSSLTNKYFNEDNFQDESTLRSMLNISQNLKFQMGVEEGVEGLLELGEEEELLESERVDLGNVDKGSIISIIRNREKFISEPDQFGKMLKFRKTLYKFVTGHFSIMSLDSRDSVMKVFAEIQKTGSVGLWDFFLIRENEIFNEDTIGFFGNMYKFISKDPYISEVIPRVFKNEPYTPMDIIVFHVMKNINLFKAFRDLMSGYSLLRLVKMIIAYYAIDYYLADDLSKNHTNILAKMRIFSKEFSNIVNQKSGMIISKFLIKFRNDLSVLFLEESARKRVRVFSRGEGKSAETLGFTMILQTIAMAMGGGVNYRQKDPKDYLLYKELFIPSVELLTKALAALEDIEKFDPGIDISPFFYNIIQKEISKEEGSADVFLTALEKNDGSRLMQFIFPVFGQDLILSNQKISQKNENETIMKLTIESKIGGGDYGEKEENERNLRKSSIAIPVKYRICANVETKFPGEYGRANVLFENEKGSGDAILKIQTLKSGESKHVDRLYKIKESFLRTSNNLNELKVYHPQTGEIVILFDKLDKSIPIYNERVNGVLGKLIKLGIKWDIKRHNLSENRFLWICGGNDNSTFFRIVDHKKRYKPIKTTLYDMVKIESRKVKVDENNGHYQIRVMGKGLIGHGGFGIKFDNEKEYGAFKNDLGPDLMSVFEEKEGEPEIISSTVEGKSENWIKINPIILGSTSPQTKNDEIEIEMVIESKLNLELEPESKLEISSNVLMKNEEKEFREMEIKIEEKEDSKSDTIEEVFGISSNVIRSPETSDIESVNFDFSNIEKCSDV